MKKISLFLVLFGMFVIFHTDDVFAQGWTDDGTVVRLTTSGDTVSIGTAVPGAKLEVKDTNVGVVIDGNTGDEASITFRQNAGSTYYSGIGMFTAGGGNAGLSLWSGNSGVRSPKVYIKNDGNVGIGTTNPSVSLHNNGDFITKGPWVDVRAYTSFSAAIDDIGASKKTLLIPNQQTVSADKTVPTNVQLQFLQGGSLSINTAVTVTINGPLDAPLSQIFSLTGTAKVILGNGYIAKVYPQWWGALGDNLLASAGANTTAINAAYASNSNATVFFVAGTYYINDAIIYGLHHKTIGQARTNTTIKQSNDTKYAFSYTSAILGSEVEVDSSLVFESINIIAKYGIQILTSGADWQKQIFPKGPIFRNISLLGTYSSADPYYLTGTEPTESELKGYGVGLSITRMFDGQISNSMIQQYGIGVFLDHCDVCLVGPNNRMTASGRNLWVLGTGISSNTIQIRDNDILSSGRVGSIFVGDCAGTIIEGNYIEQGYNAAGIAIETNNDRLTIIRGNKIDDTKQTGTPVIQLAPRYGDIVENNAFNPSSPTAPAEVKSTNWTNVHQVLALWRDNSPDVSASSPPFPEPKWSTSLRKQTFPQVKTIDNEYLMAHNSPKLAGGTLSSAWFWNMNATISRWTTKRGAAGNLQFQFNIQDRSHRRFLMKLTGLRVTGQGSVTVNHYDWAGNNDQILAPITVPFVSTTASEVFYQYIQIGATREATGNITVTFGTDNIEYESIELIPVDYIVGSATWDPNNLADGAGQTSADITVTGAKFGDFIAVSPPHDLQGVLCCGYVKAVNTVSIRIQNETGSAIDLASGTWYVQVVKQSY